MPPRNEPYTPQSRLLAELMSRRHAPVQSVAQGAFDTLGDIGEAYFAKKQMDSDAAKEKEKAAILAQAFGTAMDQGMTGYQGARMAGNAPQAQEAFGPGGPTSAAAILAGAAPTKAQAPFSAQMDAPMSADQRAGLAFDQMMQKDPAAAAENLGNIYAASKLGQPVVMMKDEKGPGGSILQRDPTTNRLTQVVAPQAPAAADKGTHLRQLIDERKAIVNDPGLAKIYDEVIAKEAERGGMRVSFGPNGEVEVTTGGLASNISNPTKTKLEDVILNGRDTISKMNAIKADFKPEYQQIGTRAEMTALGLKSKAGIPLDPVQTKSLTDFATYRRNAASNMNTAIKNATGVTVGKDEAPRLMNEIPDPGAGIFDGDDPVSFMAKIDATIKSLTSAVARAEYARKNGLDKDAMFAIPLDAIPTMIEQKGNQYADELKRANPQAQDDEIKEMVKSRLRQEFGL